LLVPRLVEPVLHGGGLLHLGTPQARMEGQIAIGKVSVGSWSLIRH
jgi:hypothetical protein